METVLLMLSAHGLQRIEFNTKVTGFSSRAWVILWSCLSDHPSICTVRVYMASAYTLKPIADALRNNVTITSIQFPRLKWDDVPAGRQNWNENVQLPLKRNRQLFHLNRIYQLFRENPHSLAHGVWDINRANDAADRGPLFEKATYGEVVNTPIE
jgi:hypothetical protein